MSTNSLPELLAAEMEMRLTLMRERSPRALKLRDEFLAAYRSIDIIDSRGTGLLNAADCLNQIIRECKDISVDGEEILRTMLVNFPAHQ